MTSPSTPSNAESARALVALVAVESARAVAAPMAAESTPAVAAPEAPGSNRAIAAPETTEPTQVAVVQNPGWSLRGGLRMAEAELGPCQAPLR